MENMRWLLLLAGIAIILVIYIFSRLQGRRGRHSSRTGRQEPSHGTDADPLFDSPASHGAIEEELERLERLISEDTAQAGGGSAPQSDTEGSGGAPGKVVTLFVLAPTGMSFRGHILMEAMETAGLQYGDMQIFHRYEGGNSGGATLFSVANMLEPGTFDPDDMEGFSTQGLVLFLQLPGPKDPVKAFDAMVESARSLADSLRGTVCDATRSALTKQTVGHLREDIIDYQLRQQVAKSAL